MEKALNHSVFPVFSVIIFLLLFHDSEQLNSSQSHSLLRIKRLLHYPPILRPWNNHTEFCNMEPNPLLTVVCYEDSVTQLHIIGRKGSSLLPKNFSIDSFFKALIRLPDLKVLSLVSLGLWGQLPHNISHLSSLEILNASSNFMYGEIPKEISSIASLRTLILDGNMFSGKLPDWLSSISLLTVLSLKNNSFNGTLPTSLEDLENLRVLALSHNHFYGKVPDLSRLKNLQVLDLEENALGPKFPQTGNKLVTLVLGKNKFRSSIPKEIESYYQLQRLDLSFNSFLGPFPQSLLSLPSVTYINIAGNKFTGMFLRNQSCNSGLEFVDLSSNLFTGNVPETLLSDSKDRVFLYSNNCLSTQIQSQRPAQLCRTEALAVGIIPENMKKNRNQVSKAILASAIVGGVLGSTILVGLILFIYLKLSSEALNKSSIRSKTETASTGTGYTTSKLLSDARNLSQSMKSRWLGLPSYRLFSSEELEVATNNFDTSAFMGEGSHGQMYRGFLKDGSCVAIRCLKMKLKCGIESYMEDTELISKLRHRNLVSALGHCFECHSDGSSVSRIFVVFEYVPNGTLRNWVSEGHIKRPLTWTLRISAAIGVAKGIQFLHTGIVPGLYRNGLKITDILLDNSLVPKIRSYNLPIFANKPGNKVGQGGASSSGSKYHDNEARLKLEEKIDVYDFGVILLEIIKGRPVTSEKQIDALIDQIQVAISGDRVARRRMVDPAVNRTCLDQSLETMMQICVRCLVKRAEERPSMEDILWNLQYAAQVQDAWCVGETLSSEAPSPA